MGGPRAFSEFQVTGMHDRRIFLDSGIFWGRKIGQVFFWGGLI